MRIPFLSGFVTVQRVFWGLGVSFFSIGFGGVCEPMAMSRSATMLPLRRAMASVSKHAEAAAEVVHKKPGTGHPKKNNLFDVARLLPGWGIGHKVAKTHWQPQTYYKIYDVKLGMPGMELPGGYIMNTASSL